MLVTFGKDFFAAKNDRTEYISLDTSKLINGHMLIVGSSGVGKSYTIRRLIAEAQRSRAKVRFHVFDVHGDLEVPDASIVQFSEQAPFGLNPLRVNPDPDFGGVRKCIQNFIRTINTASSTALGVKQEAVIRNLLLDVYREFGFYPDEPGSWAVNAYETRLISGGRDNRLYLEVPLAEKDEAKAFGARWDPEKKHWWIHADKYQGGITRWPPAYKPRTYPTVADVAQYARQIHQERFLGSDQRAVRALAYFNRKASAYQRKMLEQVKNKRMDDGVDHELELELEEAKKAALEAYEDYLNSVKTGVELDNLIKYDSAEVLKSVVDRLSNLNATGIFKDVVPPFDEGKYVWRYKLNALAYEEKKMLVLFMLQDIFSKAVQRGETSDVVEVVVLDELGTYVSSADEDGDGIIGVIAREARKFGLALWGAHQNPSGFPESFISSAGTKVVLGIDEMYWRQAVDKLRIETKLLEFIQPHRTMAVQMKEKGSLKNRWRWVQI